jgi:hypothetical protein
MRIFRNLQDRQSRFSLSIYSISRPYFFRGSVFSRTADIRPLFFTQNRFLTFQRSKHEKVKKTFSWSSWKTYHNETVSQSQLSTTLTPSQVSGCPRNSSHPTRQSRHWVLPILLFWTDLSHSNRAEIAKRWRRMIEPPAPTGAEQQKSQMIQEEPDDPTDAENHEHMSQMDWLSRCHVSRLRLHTATSGKLLTRVLAAGWRALSNIIFFVI